MQCEAEERAEGSDSSDVDPFMWEGLSSTSSDSEHNARLLPQRHYPAGRQLQAARQWHEELKQALFDAQEAQHHHHHNGESSSSGSD